MPPSHLFEVSETKKIRHIFQRAVQLIVEPIVHIYRRSKIRLEIGHYCVFRGVAAIGPTCHNRPLQAQGE
jgi:hypothetical protein